MIKVLALVIDEHKIIKPLEALSYLEIEYVVATEGFTFSAPYPDIVVTVSDWRAVIASILSKARSLHIPTLLFQDGTLDWIIQHEGELYAGSGGAPHFQPILTDKMAVMGHQSARLIASWNDASKVEVTGFPILQQEANAAAIYLKNKKPKNDGIYQVLITSTRQGWFCERQKDAFVQALIDIKKYFADKPSFQLTWRLSRNLADLVGVQNEMKEKESKELVPLIQQADLVLSAQSTVVIEAMLHGKPVAIVDYLHVPQYYGTAWKISHSDHIHATIQSMIQPTAALMQYQNYQLHDVLELGQDAIDASGKLIQAMVAHRKQYGDVNFPANMLGYQVPFKSAATEFSIQEIYPKVASNFNVQSQDMQLLLTRYKHENDRLQMALQKRSLQQILVSIYKKLRQKK